MKSILFAFCAFAFVQTAHAELTFPYKKIEIACANDNGNLKLLWDFSKGPMVRQILVNGVNELGGSRLSIENNASTYSKKDVFSISLSQEDNQRQFVKEVMLFGQNETMLCLQTSSWHIAE